MVSAKKDERPPEMTLAAEAADRKERLLALRRRKDDGAAEDGTQYVLWIPPTLNRSPIYVFLPSFRTTATPSSSDNEILIAGLVNR
jgi:hypothetical protein